MITLKNTSFKNTSMSGYLSPLDLNPVSSWNEENATYDDSFGFIQTNDAGSLGLPEVAFDPADRRTVLRDSNFRQCIYNVENEINRRNIVLASSDYNFMHNGSDAAFICIFSIDKTDPTVLADNVIGTTVAGEYSLHGFGLRVDNTPRDIIFHINNGNGSSNLLSASFTPNDLTKIQIISGILTANNVKIYDRLEKKIDVAISGQSSADSGNLSLWGQNVRPLRGCGYGAHLYNSAVIESNLLGVIGGLMIKFGK